MSIDLELFFDKDGNKKPPYKWDLKERCSSANHIKKILCATIILGLAAVGCGPSNNSAEDIDRDASESITVDTPIKYSQKDFRSRKPPPPQINLGKSEKIEYIAFEKLKESIDGAGLDVPEKTLQRIKNIDIELDKVKVQRTKLSTTFRDDTQRYERSVKFNLLRDQSSNLRIEKRKLLAPYTETISAYQQLSTHIVEVRPEDIPNKVQKVEDRYKNDGIEISDSDLNEIESIMIDIQNIRVTFNVLNKEIESGEKTSADMLALGKRFWSSSSNLKKILKPYDKQRTDERLKSIKKKNPNYFSTGKEILRLHPIKIDIDNDIANIKQSYALLGISISEKDLREIEGLYEEINAGPTLTPKEKELARTRDYDKETQQILGQRIVEIYNRRTRILKPYKKNWPIEKTLFFRSIQKDPNHAPYIDQIETLKSSYAEKEKLISEADIKNLTNLYKERDDLLLEAKSIINDGLNKNQNLLKLKTITKKINDNHTYRTLILRPYD